jgi:hypothetical protein
MIGMGMRSDHGARSDPSAGSDKRPIRLPGGFKTPEQLARELEERAAEQERLTIRWQQRGRRYRVYVLAAGVLGPALTLWGAGWLSDGSLFGWLTERGGWRLVSAGAFLGGLAAALLWWRSWGVVRGMMLFGLVIALIAATPGLVVAQAPLLATWPLLVGMLVANGGLVGFIVQLEEEG